MDALCRHQEFSSSLLQQKYGGEMGWAFRSEMLFCSNSQVKGRVQPLARPLKEVSKSNNIRKSESTLGECGCNMAAQDEFNSLGWRSGIWAKTLEFGQKKIGFCHRVFAQKPEHSPDILEVIASFPGYVGSYIDLSLHVGGFPLFRGLSFPGHPADWQWGDGIWHQGTPTFTMGSGNPKQVT